MGSRTFLDPLPRGARTTGAIEASDSMLTSAACRANAPAASARIAAPAIYGMKRNDIRMDARSAAGAIAVVLKGYPRLSETFIAQELRALEQRGFSLALYSLRHPTDRVAHPVHDEIRAPVAYLPEYLHDEPARVWRALAARARGCRVTARRAARGGATSAAIRRATASAASARRWFLPPRCRAISPTCMRTFCTRRPRWRATRRCMRGLTWSCSAHAKDIWTTPEWEKREKLDASAWITTCTEINARHLRSLADGAVAGRPQLPRDRHAAVPGARERAPGARRPRCRIGGRAPRGGPRRRQEGIRRSSRRARADSARSALAADAHRRRAAAARARGRGASARHRRSHRVARPATASRGARRLSQRRPIRAAMPGQRRRRSRRTAQRAARSAEPEARLRVDARFGHPGADRRRRRPASSCRLDRPPRSPMRWRASSAILHCDGASGTRASLVRQDSSRWRPAPIGWPRASQRRSPHRFEPRRKHRDRLLHPARQHVLE